VKAALLGDNSTRFPFYRNACHIECPAIKPGRNAGNLTARHNGAVYKCSICKQTVRLLRVVNDKDNLYICMYKKGKFAGRRTKYTGNKHVYNVPNGGVIQYIQHTGESRMRCTTRLY
jgi:hypothetical protein